MLMLHARSATHTHTHTHTPPPHARARHAVTSQVRLWREKQGKLHGAAVQARVSRPQRRCLALNMAMPYAAQLSPSRQPFC